MISLYLIRHGETVNNKKGFVQGQSDVLLSENGENQVLKLGEQLMNIAFEHAFCSDLVRAKKTVDGILKQNKRKFDVQYTTLLREIDVGDNLGKHFSTNEKNAKEAGKNPRFFKNPNGESVHDVYVRMLDFFFKSIFPLISSSLSSSSLIHILVVAHGMCIEELLNIIFQYGKIDHQFVHSPFYSTIKSQLNTLENIFFLEQSYSSLSSSSSSPSCTAPSHSLPPAHEPIRTKPPFHVRNCSLYGLILYDFHVKNAVTKDIIFGKDGNGRDRDRETDREEERGGGGRCSGERNEDGVGDSDCGSCCSSDDDNVFSVLPLCSNRIIFNL